MTLIFIMISIIRSYLVRRFFAAYATRFAAWCWRRRRLSTQADAIELLLADHLG